MLTEARRRDQLAVSTPVRFGLVAFFINTVRFADVTTTAAAPTEHFWMPMTLTHHSEAPEFPLPSSSCRGDFAVWAGGTR